MQTLEQHDAADPFGEFQTDLLRREYALLGARVEFRSRSAELMDLVDAAYGGLPAQLLHPGTGDAMTRLLVELVLDESPSFAQLNEPPEPVHRGGAGLFGAVMDGSNYCFASPAARGAQVCISRGLLSRHSYHARYELLESAVFTLASRAQGLAPLHAACIGWQGRAALLVGNSGAGKTTLTLQALLEGLQFLSEDASFVDPVSQRVTGVSNYLHPRFDALRFVDSDTRRAQIAASPVIRRRSGEEKYELDLRTAGGDLADAPLALAAVVLLSGEPGKAGSLLREVGQTTALNRIRATQRYATQLDTWPGAESCLLRVPVLELRRGEHPREGVAELRRLLAQG